MGTTKPPSSLDPAPKAGEIDKQEFNRIRQSLRDAVKETAEGEKVDAILAFANDPEIMKSPAATKAVLAEALVQSLATKDIRRAQTTLRRIRDSRALFGEEEYRASVSRVKNLAAAGGNRDLAFGLLDELRERLALSAKDAFAEKAAILRAAAQDKALKKAASQDQRQALADEMLVFAREGADLGPDISEGLLNEARKTAGTISNRERRAAFEKEMVAAKTAVAEGERYQQAVEQLAKDPADAAARKVRADILIGRGKVKEALVDLASLEHPLKSLTQETDSLLKTGAEAGGKDCFACAPRWVKAASEAKIGKNIGMLQLARELTNLAILAKNNSLDPFAMQKVKQQEALLAEAALADIQKTAVAKNEPRVAEPKMAATPKPSRQGRKGGDKNFPESIAEKWVVKYSGGNIRNYRINEDGQVLFVETNQAGIISQRGDDLVLDFSDGKLERLKLSEGSLIVEHFDPASRYPDSPNQTATGVRE